MANFIPKSIFKFKGQDGSISTGEEWGLGDIGSGTSIFESMFSGGLLTTFICSIIFLPFISPLLLILSLFSFNGKPQLSNILGILIGIYFLIDCYNHWILTSLFIFLDIPQISLIIAINIGSIITQMVLVLLGKTISNIKDIGIFLFILIIVFTIGSLIGVKYSSIIGEQYITFIKSLNIK